MAKRSARRDERRPLIEELEPRVLLSADLGGILVEVGDLSQPIEAEIGFLLEEPGEHATAQSDVSVQELRLEVVFVDVRSPDYQQLVEDLAARGEDGRRLEVVVLDPNNTTTYAAGDVVDDLSSSAQLVFANVARVEGGSGRITDALFTDASNQALLGQFELWLFDTAVVAHEEDNVAFTPGDADLANLVGVLEFNTSFIANATVGATGNVVFPAERTFLPIG